MKLRWGIASAGKISNDFTVGLETLPSDEHQAYAVGARDLSRAQEFANLHGIPKVYGSYEELAKDKDVDIVYVGVLNPQHYDVCMLMLENDKHVLCEKPLCINEKQAKKLIQYAERKKLFLMEAVWSRYFPAYQYLKKQIAAGILGKIERVEVEFGFDLMDVERAQKKSLGGGGILDLGIYTIQFSQWVFREPPKNIKATGELNSDGVDISVNAELCYSSGGVSKMKISAKELLKNQAIVKGEKGQITINNFWCPESLIDVDGTEKKWPLPESKFKINFINSVGLRYEADEARKCIMNKQIESEDMNHNESLVLARIEDEIRKQVGVEFDEDKM